MEELNKKKHFPLIRTIYLYLFALAGLIIVIIAGIRALDLGLKTFVFKDIDEQTRLNQQRYISTPHLEKIEGAEESDSFTESEKESMRNFLEDYEEWKEKNEKIDYVSVRRQEEFSSIISQVVIGLPLYLYHWLVIQKETEKEENK